MGVTTAKKRFIPGVELVAGALYTHTVKVGNSRKTYTLQARYATTLDAMNPAWFINKTPKVHYANRDNFTSLDISLYPQDKLILTDEFKEITNSQIGKIDKDEITSLLTNTISSKVGSLIPIIDDVTERTKVLEIYPFLNKNYEVTKNYSLQDVLIRGRDRKQVSI